VRLIEKQQTNTAPLFWNLFYWQIQFPRRITAGKQKFLIIEADPKTLRTLLFP